jgi:tricorn protease
MLLIASLLLAHAPMADPFDPGPNPMLMRHPTLSKTTIVFQYAGDLWSVARAGGEAHRLTSAPGVESNATFSPDGTMVAFSGQYDGNTDVFVVPAEGGVPKRLTAHPDPDEVLGWTPDSKSVVFSSMMLSNTDNPRMFTVPVTGGVPKPLPFPAGTEACMSPDAKQIAYVPTIRWEEAWKRYRGGQASAIWIGDFSDSHVKAIPHRVTNDRNPMWMGDSIYFLSDRRGPVGLYRYDVHSGNVSEEIKGEGFDIKSANAGPGAIVYERLGSINLFDTSTHQSKRVDIQVQSDFPEVRPQFKNLRVVRSISISPSGQRVVVGSRGWIFSVPASKGDARLVGTQQGVNRRDPSWSPDSKTIAFITDLDGHQQMGLMDTATNVEKRLELGDSPGFYDNPQWSPDSSKIAYTDNKLNIWVIDPATGKNTKIDTGWSRGPGELQPKWSPDSKWLTWSRDLPTHFNAVFVGEVGSGKVTQITDGLSEATQPTFDRDGKHLYFEASTNRGLASDYEDMSSFNAQPVVSNLYAVVLRKDGANPLQPESDEEGTKPKPEAKFDPKDFRIDVDDIEHRIIALPMPTTQYGSLVAGPPGSFFVVASDTRRSGTLMKFSFSDRKAVEFGSGVFEVQLSADGSKLLTRGGRGTTISSPMSPGGGTPVDLSGMTVKIDEREEWAHMYHEAWQGERMLFYDPNLHGQNADVLEKRYAPFVANICSRDDLNYLFTDMMGELVIGHMWARGGDVPGSRGVSGGLLGADYSFENGHYRLARIYDGERWNPGLYAPLAQPGINAKAGEYVLAIDGQELTEVNDIYETLEGKAGKQVKIKLGPTADGKDSREVIVVPVASEFELRSRSWSEDNRRLVDKMTGGRAGYVHIPDTSPPGWDEFNRYFYTQAGKDGLIVDERFNHGGSINDFMVNEMTKKVDFGSHTRYGHDIVIPTAGIYGPKVMLINEASGSGGDIFPFLFRQRKAGLLVGKRTWGAMLSAYSFSLLDGGSINAPDDAMYNPITGKWVIENEGTPPDLEVELDPYLWRQGRDAQLDKAIEEINKLLANYHPTILKPAYPDKSKLPPGG